MKSIIYTYYNLLLGSFLALLFVGADYSPIDKSNISVKKSPNFIFYLSDDQDQMDYGTYGNPKINTLNVLCQ